MKGKEWERLQVQCYTECGNAEKQLVKLKESLLFSSKIEIEADIEAKKKMRKMMEESYEKVRRETEEITGKIKEENAKIDMLRSQLEKQLEYSLPKLSEEREKLQKSKEELLAERENMVSVYNSNRQIKLLAEKQNTVLNDIEKRQIL